MLLGLHHALLLLHRDLLLVHHVLALQLRVVGVPHAIRVRQVSLGEQVVREVDAANTAVGVYLYAHTLDVVGAVRTPREVGQVELDLHMCHTLRGRNPPSPPSPDLRTWFQPSVSPSGMVQQKGRTRVVDW